MIIEKIPYKDPFLIFSNFANEIGAIFFDSSKTSEKLGRYSFIAIDPFQTMTAKNNKTKLGSKLFVGKNPFEILKAELNKYPLEKSPEIPTFQTGVAGFFSYDLRHHLEKLPKKEKDDLKFPDLYLGFYDLTIAFDNILSECWIISSGYPIQDKTKRINRSSKRLKWVLNKLNEINMPKLTANFAAIDENDIRSNFSKSKYIEAIKKTINYIKEGDIFEANITQRFWVNLPHNFSYPALYNRLRTINPAPFSAYINAGKTHIISSSPERFLQLVDNKVETRPIKGTISRNPEYYADLAAKNKLKNSEKDNAENVMIVDLMRNDLSKVCKDHSVKVPQLCEVESFETVHHLVSVVTGELKPNHNAIDLLQATFPGGSITGAPKIRAMEIIGEIEGISRGPYCGSIGYINFNGDMDTSITIRTYAVKNNVLTFQAGGAIVTDSTPEEEYQESLDKAFALRKALLKK